MSDMDNQENDNNTKRVEGHIEGRKLYGWRRQKARRRERQREAARILASVYANKENIGYRPTEAVRPPELLMRVFGSKGK